HGAQWAQLGDRMAFSACDPVHGCELWTTDGTDAGTALVADLAPAARNGIGPGTFAVTNGRVVFSGSRDGTAYFAWSSDGTAAGTQQLCDAALDTVNTWIIAHAGRVWFGTPGALWSTDGTAAGTTLVATFPGNAFPPELLTPSSGPLFFSNDKSLWRSDGTDAGTFELSALEPLQIADMAGTAWFVTQTSGSWTVWKSDGTAAGTVPVSTPPTFGVTTAVSLLAEAG